MRVTPGLFLLLFQIVCVDWTIPLSAQPLPDDARPFQLVRTLIQVVGSPEKGKEEERQAFRARLTGEAGRIDAEHLKGLWPAYVDVNIDSIISLPIRITHVKGDPKLLIPDRADTILRSALYVTTYINGLYDNYYFFCEKDSLWRIESWRQFPTPAQRSEIVEQTTKIDSTETEESNAFLTKLRLSRLLLTDQDLAKLFGNIRSDAADVAPQLSRSASWDHLELAHIPFDSIDEYDALDDNMPPSNRFFFRMNLQALERLQHFGIDRIARTADHAEMVLLELGTILGYTIGFAYAPDPLNIPLLNKEEFFLLKPVDANWWLFKRKVPEYVEAKREAGPLPRPTHSKSGKALLLVPKENDS